MGENSQAFQDIRFQFTSYECRKILITLAHTQTKCLSATRDAIGSLVKGSLVYDSVTSLETDL